MNYFAALETKARAMAIVAGIPVPDPDVSDVALVVQQVDRDTGQVYGLAVHKSIETWEKTAAAQLMTGGEKRRAPTPAQLKEYRERKATKPRLVPQGGGMKLQPLKG